MYRRILVPLDGSRLAEAVLPVAARLGAAHDARVILLHVLERGAPAAVHGERHLRAPDEAGAYLAHVADTLSAQGVDVTIHAHEVPEGHVPRSIASHAAEEDADLILLSTHGSGGVHQMLFGSVGQQALSLGTTPVLLVRTAAGASPAPVEAGRILVPLDTSPQAEAALEPAMQLARALDAAIHLVTVVPTVGTTTREMHAVAQVMPTASRAALELEEDHARDYLNGVVARVREEGLPVTASVRRGDVAGVLTEEARAPEVSLVVIATHGHAGMRAAWTGSVAARLLDRTRTPILLLRLDEKGRR